MRFDSADLDIYPLVDGPADRARLGLLQRVLQPTTLSLFDRIGIRPGMACADLGCGTGDVAFTLAQLVGSDGRVVGIDIDKARLEEVREYAEAKGFSNVEFRISDVRTTEVTEKFNLVYSRILLSHLSNSADVLDKMHRMLNPNGVMIVEDIDYSGYYCYPDLPAFRRCVELLYEMKRLIGGNAELGKQLPVMFLDAGLSEVGVRTFQHMSLTGEVKRYLPVSMQGGISDWIVTLDLATADEMKSIIADLHEFADNPRTVMGTPRYFQVWGYVQDG